MSAAATPTPAAEPKAARTSRRKASTDAEGAGVASVRRTPGRRTRTPATDKVQLQANTSKAPVLPDAVAASPSLRATLAEAGRGAARTTRAIVGNKKPPLLLLVIAVVVSVLGVIIPPLYQEYFSSTAVLRNQLHADMKSLERRIESRMQLLSKTITSGPENAEALQKAEEAIHQEFRLELEALQKELTELRVATDSKLSSLASSFRTERNAPMTMSGVEDMITRAIEVFAADRTGLQDFALATTGGAVIGHSALSPLTTGGPTGEEFRGLLHSLAEKFMGNANPLRSPVHPKATEWLLAPGIETPGHCLALDGTSGFVDVALHTEILLASVTLEHISKRIAATQDSAPKDMQLFGWNDDDPQMVKLGEFTYDINGPELQTFEANLISRSSSKPVKFVRLQVLSNHGHPDYTVIYRLRVHGTPAATKLS